MLAENLELQSIAIIPATVNVMPGAQVNFRVEGTLGNGDKVTLAAAWVSSGGSIDGANGAWQAPGTAGSYQIDATHGDFTAYVTNW